MPAIVTGTSVRRLARSMPSERNPDLAHDEAHAKLDRGLQQCFDVADAALLVEGIAAEIVERRGGPTRARMPPMVRNSTAGLLTATAALTSARA